MQGARTRSVESPSGCHRIGMLRGVCAPVAYPAHHILAENNDCSYCCTKTHVYIKIPSAELHNKLKSLIDCTILALGRINALPPTQRAVEIGIGTEISQFCSV